jgi:hypothetical protein
MTKRRMSKAASARALEQCRRDYDALKAQLAEVGFICEGSLVELYTSCGKPGCRCADPDRRHGPYYQLSWKEAGKTISRRLSADEARLYQEWIANRHRLQSVITQMQALSRRAGEHQLAELDRPFHGPARPRWRRRSGNRATP